MGWIYVGIAVAIPILIAIIGDIVAHRSGRPARVDPSLIRLRKGALRKRGHGIGGSKQQQLYAYGEKWEAAEKPRRLND